MPLALRILLVDRNRASHVRLEQYLRRFDATMLGCHEPAEASAAIRSFRPDLVVLDGHQVQPGSLAVLAAIRAEPDLVDLPVALVTALGATRADLDDPSTVVVAKPLAATDLIALVRFH